MASDVARAAIGGRRERMTETTTGEGWAVGSVDGMGEGPGFRKVRKELGVTAFGVNAVVLPPGYASGRHMHERQQELYFVHSGRIEFTFNDCETQVLGPGGLARVDPPTVRSFRNVSGSEDAVYLCVGGAGGYVGRDGLVPDGEPSRR
jgi:mannose-6-phosphate isomerase-like protein (cupin superfamily)